MHYLLRKSVQKYHLGLCTFCIGGLVPLRALRVIMQLDKECSTEQEFKIFIRKKEIFFKELNCIPPFLYTMSKYAVHFIECVGHCE